MFLLLLFVWFCVAICLRLLLYRMSCLCVVIAHVGVFYCTCLGVLLHMLGCFIAHVGGVLLLFVICGHLY